MNYVIKTLYIKCIVILQNTYRSHLFAAEDYKGIQTEGDSCMKFSKGNDISLVAFYTWES